MYTAGVIQTVLAMIGPIVLLLTLLACATMEKMTIWNLLTKDISELGRQRKKGIYMTRPSQFVFMACFITIALMIIIATTARCLTIETLFELYSNKNRKRRIQYCNICFIAGSCFIISMSWTPLDRTAGHLFSAMLGIFLLIVGQIIDAFNWYLIYHTISKNSKIPETIKLTICRSTFECVLLFVLPIAAIMCFIAWRMHLGSIYEWIGVSFIMFQFLFYGYQALFIDKLIQQKVERNLKSQVSNMIDVEAPNCGDTWSHRKSDSNASMQISSNDN